MKSFYPKSKNLKTTLLFVLIITIELSLLAQEGQVDKQKEDKYLDSLFLAEMMSRREVDDFTDVITIDCPVIGTPMRTVHLLKTISEDKIVYFLNLMVQGLTFEAGSKGAYILFTDGTKLMKPEAKVSSTPFREGYAYNAVLMINSNELKILGTKNIKKIRVYMFDGELNVRESEQFRIYSKNIILTK